MKSKIIITSMIIAIGLLLGISYLMNKNEKVISTITLDINPSIKIELNKNNKVLKITALNDDAKKIVNLSKGSESLEETIEKLSLNLSKTSYAENGNVSVLINTNGEIEASEIENLIASSFIKNKMNPNIIIQKSTKESSKYSKKYNISEGKAAFIEEILKDKKDFKFEDLKDKSISDLLDIKNNVFEKIADPVVNEEETNPEEQPEEQPQIEEPVREIAPQRYETRQTPVPKKEVTPVVEEQPQPEPETQVEEPKSEQPPVIENPTEEVPAPKEEITTPEVPQENNQIANEEKEE